MEWITALLNDLNGLVWGKPMLIMIFGTGLFLMIGLRFMPVLNLAKGFRLLWAGRDGKNQNEGEISPFNALMTSLSATIGTGNITGVATAIFIGGPGVLGNRQGLARRFIRRPVPFVSHQQHRLGQV